MRDARKEGHEILAWPPASKLGEMHWHILRAPQVSLLMRNRAGNFSVGRLMEFLTALRQDVEITVRPTRKEHGALSVVSV